MGHSGGYRGPLERAGPCQWRIPKSYRPDMRVDGIIFADDKLIEQIKNDQGPEQVANVATLPGIQKASLAMPDIHWGYGFCIGGVAATDPEEGGVISPGGVGYDINCGVRLLRTNLEWSDVKDRIRPLVDQLFRDIPTGVGQSGRYQFDKAKLTQLMAEGASYVVNLGYGSDHDLLVTEAGGCLEGADPGRVSDRAITRGYDQCGTLGSGNHFLEVQVVDRVLDPAAAEVMGLREGQITVLIHSGSRGLGYQVCDDYLATFKNAPKRYGFELPDWQLACAPVRSPEGQAYLGAMRAAANYAWCNRQLLAHQAREVFAEVLRQDVGIARDGAGLRRRSQHRQVRGSRRRRRPHRSRSASIARGRRGPFRPVIPISRRSIAGSVSRSSFPAAWGRQAGCWPGKPAAWSTRSARAATAPAG